MDRPQLRTLFVVIGLSIAIRGFVLFMAPEQFVADPDAYRAIATTIDQHRVFGLTSPRGEPRAIAFRPPLYPWILSWCVVDGQLSRPVIGLLHLGLGTLTAALVYLTSRRLLRSLDHRTPESTLDRLSLFAALLTLLDPILLRQSTEIMTETLAAFLAIAVIGCESRNGLDRTGSEQRSARRKWQPIALGGLLALAYLCRPTFLVWGLLIGIVQFARRPYRFGAYSGTIVMLLLLTTVAGWMHRNRNAVGHPVWATTHGGYTLLLANNELFYQYLRDGDRQHPWDASTFLNAYQHRYEGNPRTAEFWTRDWAGPANFDAAVSEYEDDRLCQESAIATMERHPKTFLWSTGVRLSRLWSPLPHGVTGRGPIVIWGVGAFYAFWMLAILVALVRHRKAIFGWRWWAIWLLLFTLSGVHSIYWSNLRMRAPAMPALAILATAALLPRRTASAS